MPTPTSHHSSRRCSSISTEIQFSVGDDPSGDLRWSSPPAWGGCKTPAVSHSRHSLHYFQHFLLVAKPPLNTMGVSVHLFHFIMAKACSLKTVFKILFRHLHVYGLPQNRFWTWASFEHKRDSYNMTEFLCFLPFSNQFLSKRRILTIQTQYRLGMKKNI